MTTPTQESIRAARQIHDLSLNVNHVTDATCHRCDDWAEIIDRETNLPALLESHRYSCEAFRAIQLGNRQMIEWMRNNGNVTSGLSDMSTYHLAVMIAEMALAKGVQP